MTIYLQMGEPFSLFSKRVPLESAQVRMLQVNEAKILKDEDQLKSNIKGPGEITWRRIVSDSSPLFMDSLMCGRLPEPLIIQYTSDCGGCLIQTELNIKMSTVKEYQIVAQDEKPCEVVTLHFMELEHTAKLSPSLTAAQRLYITMLFQATHSLYVNSAPSQDPAPVARSRHPYIPSLWRNAGDAKDPTLPDDTSSTAPH
jgi:hypothetical protein